MSGRTGDARRRTGQGGIVIKRCPVCYREVLSAYRGEVTPIGAGVIERVGREGNVYASCECGKTVVWEREQSSVKPTPKITSD